MPQCSMIPSCNDAKGTGVLKHSNALKGSERLQLSRKISDLQFLLGHFNLRFLAVSLELF